MGTVLSVSWHRGNLCDSLCPKKVALVTFLFQVLVKDEFRLHRKWGKAVLTPVTRRALGGWLSTLPDASAYSSM